MLLLGVAPPVEAETKPSSTWPQAYSVKRDQAAGTLTLNTPFYAVDRYFAPDIEAAKSLVLSGRFAARVNRLLPSMIDP